LLAARPEWSSFYNFRKGKAVGNCKKSGTEDGKAALNKINEKALITE